MKQPIRSGFFATFAGTFGLVVVAALMQRSLWPAVVWLLTMVLILIYGEEKHAP